MTSDNFLHRTFVVWPLRVAVISAAVIIISLWFTPFSKLFIASGILLGAVHSLSTMEELTGGREVMWLSIPVVVAGDVLLTWWSFPDQAFVQRLILFLQLLAVIVFTESVIVVLLSSRLRSFYARRTSNKSLKQLG